MARVFSGGTLPAIVHGMVTRKPPSEHYSESEISGRRDALLLGLLKTPPKPHADMKVSPKPSRTKAGSRKAKKPA